MKELGDSNQERFKRSIFLHYVGRNSDTEFSPSNFEEFNELVFKKCNTIKSKDFPKNDIYRLADEKLTYYNKSGAVMGESWRSEDCDPVYYISIYLVKDFYGRK